MSTRTHAMILAAGFGSRLGTLSDERPKPLLPVADIPLIRYAIALLVGHDIRDIVINLHHRGDLIRHELGDGSALGAHITYSHESTILGTGGGIRRALPQLGDSTFLVVNGKILVDLDLHALLRAHRAAKADATLVVRPDAEAARWGAIDAPAGGGPIRAFFAPGAFMFTGIHAIEPSLVARLADDGAERCIIRQGYVPWMQSGARIHAFEQRGYFMEHSTPERYLAGNVNVLRGRAPIAFPPSPSLTGIDATAHIDPTARVLEPVRIAAGARILAGATVGPDTVIGARATVAPGITVSHAVVWPEAQVRASVTSAIVTPTQILAVQ